MQNLDQIPWELEINGIKVVNHEQVLEKWKTDFVTLYDIRGADFDDEFMASKISACKENLSNSPAMENLNRALTLQEVRKVCYKTKLNKASGINKLVNELFKHKNAVKLIHVFLHKFFETGMIPNIWRKAIIHLIPKESGRSIDPLKYRGLALQCCMYKLLSAVVNEHVITFFNETNPLHDEQNGFRVG